MRRLIYCYESVQKALSVMCTLDFRITMLLASSRGYDKNHVILLFITTAKATRMGPNVLDKRSLDLLTNITQEATHRTTGYTLYKLTASS